MIFTAERNQGIRELQRTIADTVPFFHTALDPAPHVPGLIRPNPFKYEFMRVQVRRHAELTVEGRENVRKAREAQKKGKPVIWMSNHLSNADGPVFNYVLDEQGIHRTAFMLGKRLIDDPATRGFIDCVWIIPVWPPTEIPANEEEQKERIRMNMRSARAAKVALMNGFSLTVYPEGGRSYSGAMKEPQPEVASYMTLVDDAVVVPVGIAGTETILPIGQSQPQRGSARIAFGEPVEVTRLLKQYAFLPRGDERRKAMLSDVMSRIAPIVPNKYRGIWE